MFEILGKVLTDPRATLKLECPVATCRHKVTLDRATALKLFGPGAAPYDVSRRSRCTRCGARGRANVWV